MLIFPATFSFTIEFKFLAVSPAVRRADIQYRSNFVWVIPTTIAYIKVVLQDDVILHV